MKNNIKYFVTGLFSVLTLCFIHVRRMTKSHLNFHWIKRKSPLVRMAE